MANKKNIETPAAETKKKTTRVKPADKEGKFIIQSNDHDYTISDIKEMCIKHYKGDSRKQVKTIDIYVKCENGSTRAYYVVNDKPGDAYIEF